MINEKEIRHKVLTIIFMRWNLSPMKALSISEKWLEQNPEKNWSSLLNLLMKEQITVSDTEIIHINQSSTSKSPDSPKKSPVSQDKHKKKRRYRGKEYG